MSKMRRPITRGTRVSYWEAYDRNNPRAIASCDQCGVFVPHDHLRKEKQFQGGDVPVWTGFLVCGKCFDKPNPFFKRQVLPPDPRPIKNPRPGQTGFAEFLATEEDAPIATQDDDEIQAN